MPTRRVLNVLIASTRPGRVGPAVAKWFHEVALRRGDFEEVRLVDLADFGLPVYDEPKHPRLRDYAHEHTRRWSESVDAADAFVIVTPEYNPLLPRIAEARDRPGLLPNGWRSRSPWRWHRPGSPPRGTCR